jgi:hypothetical protein
MTHNKMKNRNSEKGSASIKLVAVLAALFLAAHAGYNYIPVAYEGQNFKQEMQTAVVQGMAVPPGMTMGDMVKGRLKRAAAQNNLPPDTFIQVKPANNSIQAQVAYTKQINLLPFGLFKYNYQFNHIATPTGFLLKESAPTQ